jgi:7,8-dihydroneopterin aldolase/epimerase/oxygenase
MDRITIGGLRAMGRHGVGVQERRRPQPFEIELTIDLDLSAAARSDDLADTVNYAALARRVREIVAATSFALLEALASAVLDAVFEDARVRSAQVTIAKPEILDGATPAVTLCRTRGRS